MKKKVLFSGQDETVFSDSSFGYVPGELNPENFECAVQKT